MHTGQITNPRLITYDFFWALCCTTFQFVYKPTSPSPSTNMSKKVTLNTDIVLFDLDGTLVYTTDVVEALWSELCDQYGVDKTNFFEHSHGSRTSESFAKFFPMIDNTDNKAVLKLENAIPDLHGDKVRVISGAIELLNGLNREKWCIVTSGNNYIAHSWFNSILKTVQKPTTFITAELVSKGKPDPEGYLKGTEILSKKLGLSSPKSIVFEDAPVGVKAGVAAGATVIGVSSGFDAQLLYDSGASYVVKDLTQVKVIDGDKITLEVAYD